MNKKCMSFTGISLKRGKELAFDAWDICNEPGHDVESKHESNTLYTCIQTFITVAFDCEKNY